MPNTDPSPNRTTLARAALAIGESGDTVRRMIQRRQLTGGIDERGRWWVDSKALAKFVAKQSGAAA